MSEEVKQNGVKVDEEVEAPKQGMKRAASDADDAGKEAAGTH